jgi:hypothetical protein
MEEERAAAYTAESFATVSFVFCFRSLVRDNNMRLEEL